MAQLLSGGMMYVIVSLLSFQVHCLESQSNGILTTTMSNPLSHPEDPDFHSSIQENLKQLSAQLGSPLSELSVMEIYQNACELLSHVSPSPLTLARVAGTLLVYRATDTEPEEFEWFSTQVKQCLDEEEVEELIESIHRTDAL